MVFCMTPVIRCSVLWWFLVLPWLSDVVFCGGFLFDHVYQMKCSVVVSCLTFVTKCSDLWWLPVLPWLSDVVFCGYFLFEHGYQM